MIEPVGCISTTKERLRFTLQSSPTVKEWSPKNIPRIFLDVISPAPKGKDAADKAFWVNLRPFIMIHTMPITYANVAEPGQFSPSGSMVAMFEQNTPDTMTPEGELSGEDLDRLFDNFLGQVITDMRHFSVNSHLGYLYSTRITTDGPYRSEEEDYPSIGDAQQYYLQFDWGVVAS